MLTVLFLCLSTTIASLVANPLLQGLQTQQCPICQQNAYRNIPGVVQQSATNYNPYSQVSLAKNPVAPSCQSSVIPSNNPASSRHKQSPRNNQVNQQSSNNQFNKLFVDKILSNPTLSNILDPNTKLYNQNGVEVPLYLSSVANTGAVPNVINNYIILPAELLLNNTEHDNLSPNPKNNKRRRKNGKRKQNEGKRQGQDIIDEVETTESKKPRNSTGKESKENDIDYDDIEENRNRRKSRRKKSKNKVNKEKVETKSNDTKHVTISDKQDVELHNSRSKDNERIMEKSITNSEQVNDVPTAPNVANNLLNYLHFDRVLKTYQSKSNDRAKTENVQNFPNQVNDSQPMNTRGSETSKNNNMQSLKMEQNVRSNVEKSKTREKPAEVRFRINTAHSNLKDKDAIQNCKQKFPGIPEDVVQSLLSYLKTQLQNEQLPTPNLYYPQFPINYEQLYQIPYGGGSSNSRNKNGRRKNGRRKNKRKGESNKNNDNSKNKCEITVELNPELIENTVSTTTTTTERTHNPETLLEKATKAEKLNDYKFSKPTTILEEYNIGPNNDVETTTSKGYRESESNEIITSNYQTSSITIPELGTEDIVPTIYVNGIIDDYYPDFTADNQGHSFSNEEYALKNLQEDRYRYTTDRNYELEELNRERRKYEQNLEKNHNFKRPINEGKAFKSLESNKERERSKFFSEEVENTIPRPKVVDENEKIQFKSPFKLEIPDFETKKVDKNARHNMEEYDDEPVETPQNTITKSNARRKLKNDVETVYVRSKVVKYGETADYSEEISSTPMTRYSKSDIVKNDGYQYATDGDTYIVVAQSIPDVNW